MKLSFSTSSCPVSEIPELKGFIKEDAVIENAIITNTALMIEDHGFLDSYIYLDYGGAGQAFGGWVLNRDPNWDNYEIEGVAGHYIQRVLQVAGVNKWELLKGASIRVCHNHGKIFGIGNIIRNDWFFPDIDFAPLLKKKEENIKKQKEDTANIEK